MGFAAHPSPWEAVKAFGLHINKVKNLRDHHIPLVTQARFKALLLLQCVVFYDYMPRKPNAATLEIKNLCNNALRPHYNSSQGPKGHSG